MQNFKQHILGETKEAKHIDSREENYLASLEMAGQTSRYLDIFSRDLDPFIYDKKEFVNAVKQLALKGRHSKIRILISEPEKVIHRGHRLLELAFQLSSFIELRKPGYEHRDFNESLLVSDKMGYVHRKNSARYEAKLNFSDLRLSNKLQTIFDEMWENAKPDHNLRRVSV